MAVSEPTTAKGRTTRARIIQAAAELVAERGAATMSLDDVGARAHASRSQLYHYFEDRDDLIRAVVDATTNAVLAAQDALLGDLDSWAGIDRWFATLEAIQRGREARGGCPIGSLVGQLAERDPLARAALADGFDRWEGHLRVGLERMHADGSLAPDAAPSQLATATMAPAPGRPAPRPGPTRSRSATNRARRRAISPPNGVNLARDLLSTRHAPQG